ncbi:hypothetical protein SEA_REYNAULD_85 [Rhodococcus phage Reynauld]|uniref:Uncharacterized protein n=1 Tax=Rhodococcus phage Reynauld TaxID=3062845 RepID=A0ACD4UHH5_9CAUD|nr:hypothetical protein SEA_REYNAULD_85 [Rhodococcus phage Reynauld]
MGWIKKVEVDHDCDEKRPSPNSAAPGSKWQCDDCGKTFQVAYNGRIDDNQWHDVSMED